MDDQAPNKEEAESSEGASFLQVVGSVMAAAFGVQSSKNRKRDFSQDSFTPYIVAGVLFTVAFVLGLATLVSVLV